MSLKRRMSILAFIDSCIVLFSIFIGYYLLYPINNPFSETFLIASSLAIFVAHHGFAMYYGLYRKVWEYASIRELMSIFKAVSLSILTVAAVQYLVEGHVLLRALSITWMLHILLIGGYRLSWRVFRDSFITVESPTVNRKRTLIIGAGSAGTMIARQLFKNADSPLTPVAFFG